MPILSLPSRMWLVIKAFFWGTLLSPKEKVLVQCACAMWRPRYYFWVCLFFCHVWLICLTTYSRMKRVGWYIPAGHLAQVFTHVWATSPLWSWALSDYTGGDTFTWSPLSFPSQACWYCCMGQSLWGINSRHLRKSESTWALGHQHLQLVSISNGKSSVLWISQQTLCPHPPSCMHRLQSQQYCNVRFPKKKGYSFWSVACTFFKFEKPAGPFLKKAWTVPLPSHCDCRNL